MELFDAAERAKLSKLLEAEETPVWKYWDDFVLGYLELGRSEVTVLKVRDGLRFVCRSLKLVSIEKLNDAVFLRKSLLNLKKIRRWKPGTYNTYIKNMNTYFLWLLGDNIIGENNVGKTKRCVEKSLEQHTLTQQEVSILLAKTLTRGQSRFCRARNVLIIQLLINFGLRNCELLQIKKSDIRVDGNGYKLVVHGRKQKGRLRYYRLKNGLRDAYDNYLKELIKLNRDVPELFVSSCSNSKFTKSGLRKLFVNLSAELGFTVNVYAIRRYVATKLYAAEIPLQKIADYLGHTRVQTTLRYIESSCVRTNECVDYMARGVL